VDNNKVNKAVDDIDEGEVDEDDKEDEGKRKTSMTTRRKIRN